MQYGYMVLMWRRNYKTHIRYGDRHSMVLAQYSGI